MRILQFCNYADRVGGAEVYAHALAQALRERGHEVALFGASPQREVDEPCLRVIKRPPYSTRLLIRDPQALEALRRFMDRFRPEVVHAHNVFSVALDVLQHLWSGAVPLVQTVHDLQLLCPNSWCVRGDGTACPGGAGAQCFQHACEGNYPYDSWSVWLSSLRQGLVSGATGIALAPSSFLAERLRSHGWRDVRHLPHFIDFEPAAPGRTRSEHALLFVGRLEREKGVEVLLEAMPEIRAAFPRVQLDLVGSGSLERSLQRSVKRLGLGAAVRFLTHMPRPQLADHYARAALCVLPSIWTENSPLVAHECLCSGLPMVGSRSGGIPELIEPGCGFVFTPRDPHDLARAVVRFLRLPLAERQSMSDAALARSRDFDKGRHMARVEGYYSELISAPPRVPESEPLSEDQLSILSQVNIDYYRPRLRRAALELIRGTARRLGLPKVLDR